MITSTKQVQRALAASTALAVAALGATATTAAATPAHDKAPGHSRAQGHGGASQDQADARSQGQGQGKAQGRSSGNVSGQQSPASPAAPQGTAPGRSDQAPGHQSASGPAGKAGAGKAGAGKAGAGQAGDPAGNNGTVKITPHGEVDGIPQNTPHVGCVFDVEWYGFDEGDDIVSQVTFQSWAPTRVPMTVDGPGEVFVGADPASGAGVGSDADGTDTDNGFDGEATYTLSFDGEPHPQQGYHVKLTINTPGSQGADVKHKVFWVQACEEAETPETPETPDTPDTPDTPEVAGEQGVDDDSVDTGVEVLGEQATAPTGTQSAGTSAAVPTAVDAGLATAQWVASTPSRGLLVVLLGLLVAGVGLVLRRRA